jgi:hypothetical protein
MIQPWTLSILAERAEGWKCMGRSVGNEQMDQILVHLL